MTAKRVVPTKRVRLIDDPAVAKTVMELLRTIDESGFGGKLTVHVYPPQEGEEPAVDLNTTVRISRADLLKELDRLKKQE